MASLLRQLVAGPRAHHHETDLDLSYITPFLIATSGPSQTYPQRAYRNPLDHLVSFLDSKHEDDWAIWEFRAEGTGYPDDLVYGRVRHYPWPDHHPPPFRLVPMIMASMRNWLHGGELHDEDKGSDESLPVKIDEKKTEDKKRAENRVVVVHCKAGKGRSGSMACSYLISEEGWTAEDALARFTARRMRPQFGAGVSIPSQLRWVSYVDRWTKAGKRYIDRPIEILEVHVWGLRNGVKIDVDGFEDEGKKIKSFHTFNRDERMVVEGDAPEGGGLSDMVWELAGYASNPAKREAPEEAELSEPANNPEVAEQSDTSNDDHKDKQKLKHRPTELIKKASASSVKKVGKLKTMTFAEPASNTQLDAATETPSSEQEPGGMAVILKPKTPIILPNSDVNISCERRNRTHKSMGLTMVSAVGHVWFNAYFEGQGPEQDNKPDESGIFSIEWNGMDGIKGTSRKGARALDRLAVVWRVADGDAAAKGEEVDEPAEGKPVPQTKAADWKGANEEGAGYEKNLGLRTQSPASADVSQGSSVKSADAVIASMKLPTKGDSSQGLEKDDVDDDQGSISGVRSSGPTGEELEALEKVRENVGVEIAGEADTASGTTKAGTTEVVENKK